MPHVTSRLTASSRTRLRMSCAQCAKVDLALLDSRMIAVAARSGDRRDGKTVGALTGSEFPSRYSQPANRHAPSCRFLVPLQALSAFSCLCERDKRLKRASRAPARGAVELSQDDAISVARGARRGAR